MCIEVYAVYNWCTSYRRVGRRVGGEEVCVVAAVRGMYGTTCAEMLLALPTHSGLPRGCNCFEMAICIIQQSHKKVHNKNN